MKTKYYFQRLLTLFIVFAVSTTLFAPNVTLKVIDSEGNPISAVPISIFKANVGGAGTITTDANGEATLDLANYSFGYGYSFTAKYAYSKAHTLKPLAMLMKAP